MTALLGWRRVVPVLCEVVGLAWALGVAVSTASLFALYLGRVAWSIAVPLSLGVGGVLVVAMGRLLWRSRLAEQSNGAARPIVAIVGGLAVVIAQTCVTLSGAWRSPLSAWDAWSIWTFKARMFALGGPPAAYFHDRATLFTHPDYPLNLPLLQSVLLRLAGHLDARVAALPGPLCLLALLLLFFAGLSRLYGPTLAALSTGALALVPALGAQAAGGDADIPLAMYAGASTLYLLLWWRRRQPLDAVLAGALAGGAIWTKKEGLAIGALLLLALCMDAARRDAAVRARLAPLAGAFGAAGAIALPWLAFTHAIRPIGRDFLPLTAVTFMAHLDRLPQIGAFMGLQMLSFANWSLLWLVLAAIVPLALRRADAAGRGLLLLLAGQVGIYVLAFVFSDWRPYQDHMRTSLDRLLVQAVPLAVLLLVEVTHAAGRRDDVAALPEAADLVA